MRFKQFVEIKEGYEKFCILEGILFFIAIFMTGTLIWGQLTYAPMQSLLCAFIAVATGLPVFYYWDKKNKKTNNSEA